MLIAVDFDNVLIQHSGIPAGDYDFEEVYVKDALAAIKWLKKQGHEVYVLTARFNIDWPKIDIWLHKWKFPSMDITNIKKNGTAIYIDDRAIRFTNWQDVCRYLGK